MPHRALRAVKTSEPKKKPSRKSGAASWRRWSAGAGSTPRRRRRGKIGPRRRRGGAADLPRRGPTTRTGNRVAATPRRRRGSSTTRTDDADRRRTGTAGATETRLRQGLRRGVPARAEPEFAVAAAPASARTSRERIFALHRREASVAQKQRQGQRSRAQEIVAAASACAARGRLRRLLPPLPARRPRPSKPRFGLDSLETPRGDESHGWLLGDATTPRRRHGAGDASARGKRHRRRRWRGASLKLSPRLLRRLGADAAASAAASTETDEDFSDEEDAAELEVAAQGGGWVAQVRGGACCAVLLDARGAVATALSKDGATAACAVVSRVRQACTDAGLRELAAAAHWEADALRCCFGRASVGLAFAARAGAMIGPGARAVLHWTTSPVDGLGGTAQTPRRLRDAFYVRGE